MFQLCQRVEEGLKSHNTGPCLAWCHDNRSKLRRLKSSLEYRVRLQDFIELIRQERRLDAVKYVYTNHFDTIDIHIGYTSLVSKHVLDGCVIIQDH